MRLEEPEIPLSNNFSIASQLSHLCKGNLSVTLREITDYTVCYLKVTLTAYLRVLRDIQPKAFLLENVHGLAFKGKDEGLKKIIQGIEQINRETGARLEDAKCRSLRRSPGKGTCISNWESKWGKIPFSTTNTLLHRANRSQSVGNGLICFRQSRKDKTTFGTPTGVVGSLYLDGAHATGASCLN